MPVVHYGAPLDRARVIALLIHGRNQEPATMDASVVKPLALADVAYLAPAAAEQSWYPAGFMAAVESNEPRLAFALERIAALVDELAPHVVIGFSQGACVACEHVYRASVSGRGLGRMRALIAFTGGLIGPPGMTWRAGRELAGVAVQVSGSTADPWVPEGRMRETAEVFAGLGARVETWFHVGDGHGIVEAELAMARALL
jgi:predicted esterase